MLEIIFLLSIAIEWLLYFWPLAWENRKYVIWLPLALTIYGSAALLMVNKDVFAVFVIVISVFRVVNQLRIVKGRMHDAYLKISSRWTGLILGDLQVLLLLASSWLLVETSEILHSLAVSQLLVTFALLMLTIRNIHKSTHRPVAKFFSDKELPTITVAIPARNETAELEDCLQSILANDYPKFEVIVLDDCSQDNTPEIIKQYANKGVRFIKGAEPNDNWLAKNRAYDRLADEATGELVLFCGVDVRFGPDTIRSLVTTLLNRKKDMVSIMPRRMTADPMETIVQPMRYWWEIALPRRYFNRPPVLSTCWIIRRKTLKKLGGLDAVQHSIIPEGYFARELVKSDGYSFIRADDVLDVTTRKNAQDQRDTAIRMRYPQIRRRPELAMLLTLAELLYLLAPFVMLASSLWAGFGYLQLISLFSSGLLIITHVLIVYVSNPAAVPIALINFPVVVMTEVILGQISLYKYEFSTVDWKGRNVCIPVMHVYPHLPKMN